MVVKAFCTAADKQQVQLFLRHGINLFSFYVSLFLKMTNVFCSICLFVSLPFTRAFVCLCICFPFFFVNRKL